MCVCVHILWKGKVTHNTFQYLLWNSELQSVHIVLWIKGNLVSELLSSGPSLIVSSTLQQAIISFSPSPLLSEGEHWAL